MSIFNNTGFKSYLNENERFNSLVGKTVTCKPINFSYDLTGEIVRVFEYTAIVEILKCHNSELRLAKEKNYLAIVSLSDLESELNELG